MSQIEKLFEKFIRTPQNVRYTDIEKILLHLGFEKIGAKGSHVKWKHKKVQNDIVIPVHNNDCKIFYKKQVLEQVRNLIK